MKYQQEIDQCKYEPEDVGDENAIEVEFKVKFMRILFKNYYKIIAKTEDRVKAVCRSCKLISDNSDKLYSNFRRHLMVCAMDVKRMTF